MRKNVKKLPPKKFVKIAKLLRKLKKKHRKYLFSKKWLWADNVILNICLVIKILLKNDKWKFCKKKKNSFVWQMSNPVLGLQLPLFNGAGKLCTIFYFYMNVWAEVILIYSVFWGVVK